VAPVALVQTLFSTFFLKKWGLDLEERTEWSLSRFGTYSGHMYNFTQKSLANAFAPAENSW
jgi:hypothetical protein